MGRRILAFAFALSGLWLAGASQPAFAEDPVKIAFVTHGQSSDSYWGVVKKGVDDAAKVMGADVSYQAPQTTDMVAMSRMIDAAVTQKVQGLVVSIPDATALEKSVKAAADAEDVAIGMADVNRGQAVGEHRGSGPFTAGARSTAEDRGGKAISSQLCRGATVTPRLRGRRRSQ